MTDKTFTIDVNEIETAGEVILSSQGKKIRGSYRIYNGKGTGITVDHNDFEDVVDGDAQSAIEEAENLYWNGIREISWMDLMNGIDHD